MRTWILIVAVAASGCHRVSGGDDLGPPPADLAADDAAAAACAPPATGTRAQLVWNAATAPLARTDFAYDLNGDGRVDNQLGNVDAALTGAGINVQDALSAAIGAGQTIVLLDEESVDATFANDDCASSHLYAGVATSAPDFSGAGHFTVDGSATVGQFSGPIVASRFTSAPPPSATTMPSPARVPVPAFAVVPLDLVGVRITYLRDGSGKVTSGQLDGALRGSDVRTRLVPGMATVFTAEVKADPSSATAQAIEAAFDGGGKAAAPCGQTCQNLDGSCAVANDGKLDDCEVATSSLLAAVLASDVQMFDAAGNYHPSADNTAKDSFSVGLAFTAVPATF